METVHIHYDLETKQHASHQFEALYLKSFALNKAAVKASFTVITVETQMKFLQDHSVQWMFQRTLVYLLHVAISIFIFPIPFPLHFHQY